MRASLVLSFAVSTLAACSSSSETPNSGDAMLAADDAAPNSPADASSPTPSPDFAVNFPAVPCVEQGQMDIWAPVAANLSLPGDLGRILACVHVSSVGQGAVNLNATFLSHGWTATNGFEQYIIQYVSQGPVGTLHRVTASLYLPNDNKGPYPLVAVNHGTSGVGPSCGPTHRSVVVDYMAIPMAGHGYAVVATDYPGMGVDEGISPFLVGEAEAMSVLDGVRALRHFHDSRFDASQLSPSTFIMGHSQGGQATLFAHQLWDAYLGEGGGKLLGSISFAPALGDLRMLNGLLGDPAKSIDAFTVLIGLGLYGNMAYHGAPAPATWLTPSAVAMLPTMLHDQCIETLTVGIPLTWPKQGDLFSASFLGAVKGCPLDGTTPCPALVPWTDYLAGDVPGNFHSDAPALILQGEKDALVFPATTACVVKHLKDHSTDVQACGYPNADHVSVPDASFNDALGWVSARLAGRTTLCPAPLVENCP